MSYGLTVKVTVKPEKEDKRKIQREFDEFIHRFRDFLKPIFVYDPVKIREFMVEKDRLIREYDLGFYERILINEMYRNVKLVEERKRYEIIGEDYHRRIWFL